MIGMFIASATVTSPSSTPDETTPPSVPGVWVAHEWCKQLLNGERAKPMQLLPAIQDHVVHHVVAKWQFSHERVASGAGTPEW